MGHYKIHTQETYDLTLMKPKRVLEVVSLQWEVSVSEGLPGLVLILRRSDPRMRGIVGFCLVV